MFLRNKLATQSQDPCTLPESEREVRQPFQDRHPTVGRKDMRFIAAVCLTLGALLSSCGGSDDDPPVTVVKSVESIQCVTRPETIEQLDAALARANITPSATACGWDGIDRLQSCGAKSAYLRIIVIPSNQQEAALALGYGSPNRFERVAPTGCPQNG